MQFIITWFDSTLQENYKDFNDLKKTYQKMNIDIKLEPIIDNWFDFLCKHKFTVKNEDLAVKYVKNYEFGMSDPDSWDLINLSSKEVIYTEEDYNLGE